ncbi:MAG: hypothetical protein TREMPRED_004486 [Tremellales sp. Tagirdzhanova-0007]|nr:MAG: hypothetical protein TREMPRED_004486 [Tremellales sp. Tagirdzhanova-0007]
MTEALESCLVKGVMRGSHVKGSIGRPGFQPFTMICCHQVFLNAAAKHNLGGQLLDEPKVDQHSKLRETSRPASRTRLPENRFQPERRLTWSLGPPPDLTANSLPAPLADLLALPSTCIPAWLEIPAALRAVPSPLADAVPRMDNDGPDAGELVESVIAC